MGFRKRHRQQPELGEGRPGFAAEAGLRGRRLLACLERVALADQAVDGVLQQPLVFGEREIHGWSFLLRTLVAAWVPGRRCAPPGRRDCLSSPSSRAAERGKETGGETV